MRVKAGDKVLDSRQTPIMFIFDSEEERDDIVALLQAMAKGATRFAMFPEGFGTKEEMRNWMHLGDKVVLGPAKDETTGEDVSDIPGSWIPYKNRQGEWVWRDENDPEDKDWPGFKPPADDVFPEFIDGGWKWVREE